MIYAQSSFVYFNYPLRYAIESLGKAGYQAIEIWGGRPHYYHDDLDNELPALLRLLDQYEMTVPNFIPAQFRYPSILCSLNEKVRQDSVKHIKKTIDTALKVKARSISLCPGMALYEDPVEKAWKALKTSLCEILDYTENSSLSILIEPAHRWESNLICTINDCIRMINEIKSPRLGICFDTGHAHLNNENFHEAIALAIQYPLHIHVDDNTGETDSHLIPGKGTINFSLFRDALLSYHYNNCLSVELGFQYTLSPDEAVKESLMFLKNLFG